MESIERKIENNAIIFDVNLLRATLNEASEFKDLLEETILDSNKDIIVNLGACEHLDSTFLGVLVSGYKRLKSQNRTLVIIEPVDQSSIFLTLNSIGKIFPLYTSVKVALEDIENKKLIENEIKELNDLPEKTKTAPSSAPYRISSISFLGIPEEKVPEETIIQKDLPGKVAATDSELPDTTIFSKNNFPEENEVVLIENNGSIIDSSKDFMPNSDEDSVKEKRFNLRSKEKKERKVTKSKPVTSEKDFRHGTVEWKFGFS